MGEHELVVYKNGTCIKCVQKVDGFSEKEVKLTLSDERKLIIVGSSLKIVGFSEQTGDLSLSGKIDSLSYRQKGDKFIKRILK